jgi:hypothetical protein
MIAGRDGEQRQSSYRCRSCAKPIRRLAAEYDAGGRDEKVGIDRPFNASGAQRELGLQARQRGHDRRAVGADREHSQAS